jgi:putative transposase
MPEHVHLLIWPRRRKYETSRIVADIKRPVGQKAVAFLEEVSPEFLERLTVRNRNHTYRRFWQAGPGQDRNVYDPATAHKIIEYIHYNPVRRALVVRPEDWVWSSAADWAGKVDVPIKVDRTIPAVAEFYG